MFDTVNSTHEYIIAHYNTTIIATVSDADGDTVNSEFLCFGSLTLPDGMVYTHHANDTLEIFYLPPNNT